MSIKLRELIRNIRNCKTAAEERSVVAKECALIRTAFKEEDNVYRHRNVAKLLFINMLGYPTYFGQIECLKLIASNKFSFKRIGYLGLTILLDENTDILMLVTNSIKNDLRNNNQYINGLALCALGNIANSEMCSSLRQEILDMMNINNPYIKKKAIMCAIRILKKTNDIEDLFIERINNLLDDRNHGVISAGISLMISIIEKKPHYKHVLKGYTNKIVKILKGCVMSGYSHGAEYDIYGINDPFLQVKILKLLKYLNSDSGQGGTSGSRSGSNSRMDRVQQSGGDMYDMEEVNSVLAQVATNTDSLKNVGNAILYECVKTITYISTDPGLLVLAVNVLGKFLQNTDNNIRYVGLCTLQKLLKKDPKTLHIYRNTIIECLKDQDISIRKKALDVAFALITKDSLKVMVKELLNYLLVADMEIKSDIVSNICVAINKYSPDIQYLLDTYIKLFCLAGNFIQDHIKDDFIYYLLQNPEFHSYVVFKIFFSIRENIDQYALVQVGVWCIGELGDLLIQEKNIGPDEEVITVTHEDVFNLLDKIVKTYEHNRIKELHNINIKDPIHNIIYSKQLSIFESNTSNTTTCSSNNDNTYVCCNINENANNDDTNIILQYILMCLNKLTVRFPSQKNKIEKLIEKYKKNKCIEIQQRACEFHELMNPQWDDIRDSVLLRIPPGNKKMNRKKNTTQEDHEVETSIDDDLSYTQDIAGGISTNIDSKMDNTTNDNASAACVDLLDLDDVLGLQTTPSSNDHNGLKSNRNKMDIHEQYSVNTNEFLKISSSPKKEEQHTLDFIPNYNNREQQNDINSEIVKKKNEDILVDLFGNISIDDPKKNLQHRSGNSGDNPLDILMDDAKTTQKNDLLNLSMTDEVVENAVKIEPLRVYDKNGIEIVFHFEKENLDAETTTIKAVYSNKLDIPISSFVFEVGTKYSIDMRIDMHCSYENNALFCTSLPIHLQAVVPNYVKLEILIASSSELLPYGENKITQNLKVVNKLFRKKPVLMKVRLSYMKKGEQFQDFINIGNFPDAL
ncbi:adapter-related protein complex 1 gamma 2 subunit [Plasmodium ovale wallikeri]|uniref:AP-1 complex subunit gamma n=1 Tax=Plasmodium ovale wallikeri TaxID=864142 RepID=A0A1A8ZGD5_PLAOA|nr:adapter-related protein complex 1 gamma 2 subunit [Plasmodium ovale wallikeri]